MGKRGFCFNTRQSAIVLDAHLYFIAAITEGKAQSTCIVMQLYLVERFLGDAIEEAFGITWQRALFAREGHPT